MANSDVAESLRKGIRAARRGHHKPAQRLLSEVVEADPSNEEAWMWLARVVDDPARQAECYQQILSLNPDNSWANEQLAALQAGPEEVELEEGDVAPELQPISSEYELELLKCPNCGNPLDVQGTASRAIVCPACDSVLDLTAEQADVIGQANKKSRALLPIEPGMNAKINGVLHQVIWLVALRRLGQ